MEEEVKKKAEEDYWFKVSWAVVEEAAVKKAVQWWRQCGMDQAMRTLCVLVGGAVEEAQVESAA